MGERGHPKDGWGSLLKRQQGALGRAPALESTPPPPAAPLTPFTPPFSSVPRSLREAQRPSPGGCLRFSRHTPVLPLSWSVICYSLVGVSCELREGSHPVFPVFLNPRLWARCLPTEVQLVNSLWPGCRPLPHSALSWQVGCTSGLLVWVWPRDLLRPIKWGRTGGVPASALACRDLAWSCLVIRTSASAMRRPCPGSPTGLRRWRREDR